MRYDEETGEDPALLDLGFDYDNYDNPQGSGDGSDDSSDDLKEAQR